MSRRPPRPVAPTVTIDMASVKADGRPFDAYCVALSGTVQAAEVELRVVSLLPGGQAHGVDERNWNRDRKCTWLIARRK